MFDIRLQTVIKSTWKSLKLDWTAPRIFFFQKSGNPDKYQLNECVWKQWNESLNNDEFV